MQAERRQSINYDYEELVRHLNESQKLALKQIERFGWELHFVRKPLFQNVIPVVISGDNGSIGILEEDGRINMEVDLPHRSK